MPGKITLCKRLGDMVPPDHPTLIRYAASSSSSSRSPRGGGRQGKGNSGKRPYQKRQLSKDDKLKKPKHIRDLFKSLRSVATICAREKQHVVDECIQELQFLEVRDQNFTQVVTRPWR